MSWIGNLVGRRKRREPGAEPRIVLSTARPASDGGHKKTATQSFPSFQSTASGNRDFIAPDKFIAVRRRLRDTYTPSQPVTDRRVFAGRADILTTTIRAIEDDRSHIIVYGHRGIGKTSTLHVLAQAARDAQYHVIDIACGSTFTFDEVTHVIASALPLRYHDNYGPTSSEAEAGGTFADLLPKNGPINSRLAGELLSHVVGTRVLVCLDEFDRCELPDFRRSVAELLKNCSDRSTRVQFVMAGVASDLTELLNHAPSVQRNILALQMPPMSNEELAQLVRNGEPLTGLRFEDDCIELIITIARGLPHLASLITHYAGLSAIDRGRLTVTRADLCAAVGVAFHQIGQRISKRAKSQVTDRCNEGMQSMLEAMAAASMTAGGEAFRLADVSRIAKSTEAAARRAADELVQGSTLITSVEDEWGPGYRFTDEAVPVYIWLMAAQAQLLPASESDEPQNVKQRASQA